MGSTEQQTSETNSNNDESLRLAVAISLLRSKLLQKQPPPPPPDSNSLKWKRKAKERKEEIQRLREHLRETEDAMQTEVYPQVASCKCYFFDDLGRLSANKRVGDGSERRFNDVLRRRFLRQVRFKERRRRSSGSSQQRLVLVDLNIEDDKELLRASVDFLVELCDTMSKVDEGNFKNWSHQAVDFILASLKAMLSKGKMEAHIEGIINSLLMHLVRRLCAPSKEIESDKDDDPQFYIQHLIRKLGIEPYIGHRAILAISQRVSILMENLLFLDPFDDAFPDLHQCMFILIQLIEFLVSDYLSTWSSNGDFDDVLFEEWVRSVLQVRKASECLESRNGLYVLYIDRVLGELAKLVGQIPSLQKLSPDILESLF